MELNSIKDKSKTNPSGQHEGGSSKVDRGKDSTNAKGKVGLLADNNYLGIRLNSIVIEDSHEKEYIKNEILTKQEPMSSRINISIQSVYHSLEKSKFPSVPKLGIGTIKIIKNPNLKNPKSFTTAGLREAN